MFHQERTEARAGTLRGAVPRRADDHRLALAPEYLATLAKRLDEAIEAGHTWTALAEGAAVSRTTLWRLAGRQSKDDRDRGQRITFDAVERVRLTLNRLAEPGAAEIPPPMVAVRSLEHYRALISVDARRRK